jgi:hypothetical protein
MIIIPSDDLPSIKHGANMGEVIRFIPKSERERLRLIQEARAKYDNIFPPADQIGGQQEETRVSHTISGHRDQDRRRALQSLLSGQLPRAYRHHLRLRRRLDAVLPDGRAAACRLDEAASGRALGHMALRNRQTGWQGSLR